MGGLEGVPMTFVAKIVQARKQPRFLQHRTEVRVQGLSFVGFTSEVRSPRRLWNLQNLGPVPPYKTRTVLEF